MIGIKNVTKTYKGGKRALENVTLELMPGDLFGFIGQNGAGKTTAIKCMVGLLEFEEGDILIDGQSIKTQPIACKRKLAYIPDNPDLYETLTGLQYIDFISDVYGVPTEERNRRIQHYAGLFGIREVLGDTISSYSHGMKQKVSLVAALTHAPQVLVLDEPFVGLDPKAAYSLKNIFKQLCQQGGTIFFSTHVLEVAQSLCNKIGIIKEGKIIAFGTTEQIVGDKSLEQIFLQLVDDGAQQDDDYPVYMG